MPPINILIMIHGMAPNAMQESPFEQYERFWRELCARQPGLEGRVTRCVGVCWGQDKPQLVEEPYATALRWGYCAPAIGAEPREDERLTEAQINVASRVCYGDAPGDPRAALDTLDLGIPGVRAVIRYLRDNIILYGVSDAFYYCSAEGERTIRRAVYEQILSQIEAVDGIDATEEVRLHIVAHSLGVTVAHDFLYGLFARSHHSDFLRQKQGTSQTRALFRKWRARARAKHPTLRLGSFVAMASQLPIFMMRKQELVDIMRADGELKPAAIGINKQDPQRRWLIFYDLDDLLGFRTRRLYEPCDAIAEIQVDVSDRPDLAHTGYWQNITVIDQTAELLAANCR